MGKLRSDHLSLLVRAEEGGEPSMTQVAPTLSGYVPPKGYRVVKTRQLEDGSYEITLEPPRKG